MSINTLSSFSVEINVFDSFSVCAFVCVILAHSLQTIWAHTQHRVRPHHRPAHRLHLSVKRNQSHPITHISVNSIWIGKPKDISKCDAGQIIIYFGAIKVWIRSRIAGNGARHTQYMCVLIFPVSYITSYSILQNRDLQSIRYHYIKTPSPIVFYSILISNLVINTSI